MKRKTITSTRRPLTVATRLAIAATVIGLSSQAHALSFKPSEDLEVEWDTSITYGLAWRTEERDPQLSNAAVNPLAANTNDGNNSFDDGSLINNRISFLTEADFNYKGDYGAFIRASGFYDDVYHGSNDNTDLFTNNCLAGGSCSRANQFPAGTVDQHGDRIRLLDAYLYGSWDLSGQNLSLRLGRQVVSWGESLYLPFGISSAQSPADATKANVPGVEVKDIFLPVGQIYGQLDLSDTLALQAYYQYEWAKTEIDGVGSYFSITDQMDKGGNTLISTSLISRAPDERPDDDGQWGVGVTYLAEELNSSEFGVYYIRFHDKTPQLDNLLAGVGLYNVTYFEDIDLIGLSFSTVVGDTNVSGEISYRDGQPVLVSVPTPGFATPHAMRAETVQAQVSFVHAFGTNAISDSANITGEVGYNRVLDFETFTAFGPGMVGDSLYYDKSAWGYTLGVNLDYYNVFDNWDLTVPFVFSHAVNGSSSLVGSFGLGEGDNRLSIGTTFRYLNNLTLEARYTAFLGDASESLLADRDNFAINAKYSF